MERYDHRELEPRWQARFAEADIFRTPEKVTGEKAYILDFFPYPSGSGLHVGHMLGYTGTDVMARAARMQGKAVLHPMGWDAFGLPAENYAIKTGIHPAISTEKNIEGFKRQFRQTGISYDWSREINASDPEYYRWTQWFFQLLYKRGLAYRKEGLVNWCPSCQTVLANEQVVNGACERCGSAVEQRMLKQWYFKITEYAERLLNDLDTLDWPEKIKAMQRNWIGRSEGARLWFEVEPPSPAQEPLQLEVFTTRPDTVYGATYVVLAPEHPLLEKIVPETHRKAVAEYRQATAKKSELERTYLDKAKTGVFSGAYAINPASKEKIPVWVADYVLLSYGTGAIMAVPAHDERDQEFAAVYNLPSTEVVQEDGILVNSGPFSGKLVATVLDALIESVGGEKTVTYRLRDWLVSRQRFWGAPIPIAYDEAGNEYLIPETELPVQLPMNIAFKPTGKSPLADAKEWRAYTDPISGKQLTREVDTLDTFVCSSWYFLRFTSPHYSKGPFDPNQVAQWLPVDTYVGGAEHAVLHLLYARFFTKVLFDAGLLQFEEPFASLRNPGMVLGPDHQKMSKSKGNVINPDDVVQECGADTLRLYELFMGPFEQEKPWSTKGIQGVRRFLEKVWRLQDKLVEREANEEELVAMHRAIAKLTRDIEQVSFNTAVAQLMETVNVYTGLETISKETFRTFLILLSPFAPHIAEELWERTAFEGWASLATWPKADERYLVSQSVQYPVQVNGKVRARVTLARGLTDPAAIEQAVLADVSVQNYLKGKEVRKVIVVPGKLVSLVLA